MATKMVGVTRATTSALAAMAIATKRVGMALMTAIKMTMVRKTWHAMTLTAILIMSAQGRQNAGCAPDKLGAVGDGADWKLHKNKQKNTKNCFKS